MSNLYLQKIKIKGIKGFEKQILFDMTPSKSREYIENVEFWGLDREKYEFGALKSIVVLGENNTGKSSFLEGLFTLFRFLKLPQTFMQSNMYKDILNVHSSSLEFEAEFVTKVNDRVVKYFYELSLNCREGVISKESLDYFYTSEGRKISDRANLYAVANNLVTRMFGNNLGENNLPLFTYGQNGLIVTKMHMTNPALMQGLKSVSDLDKDLVSHFFDGLSARINRDFSIGTTNEIQWSVPNRSVISKKAYEKHLAIFKLFDENIIGFHSSPTGDALLEYKFGSKTLTKRLFEVSNLLSAGTLVSFSLVVPIITSMEQENAKILFDEFGKSLHPELANFLMAMMTLKGKGQLFFTTHNPELATISFRKDQVLVLKYDDSKENVKVVKASDVILSKNQKFDNSFLNSEFLSSPKQLVRDKIWDLLDEE